MATATAKDIVIKVIPSKIANDFIKKHHYSGKVVNNSQLHFGAFLGGAAARCNELRLPARQAEGLAPRRR